jgi:hypothetical protein
MPLIHIGEWRCSSSIFDLVIRWRNVVSFKPVPLNTQKIASGTHWMGGSVGRRAGPDSMEKRKILPLPGIESWPSSP